MHSSIGKNTPGHCDATVSQYCFNAYKILPKTLNGFLYKNKDETANPPSQRKSHSARLFQHILWLLQMDYPALRKRYDTLCSSSQLSPLCLSTLTSSKLNHLWPKQSIKLQTWDEVLQKEKKKVGRHFMNSFMLQRLRQSVIIKRYAQLLFNHLLYCFSRRKLTG